MSNQPEHTYVNKGAQKEPGLIDQDDSGEEEDQPQSKRRRTEQPVVPIPAVDTQMLDSVQKEAIRDNIAAAVRGMVDDYHIITTDPVWAEFNEAWGNEKVVQFFQGGHPLPPPQPLSQVPPEQASKKRARQQDVADVLHDVMLGEGGQGRVPTDGSEPEGVFQKGANQPGSWMAAGEKSYVEGPRNYSAEYDIAVAHGLAQAVINWLTKNKTEVTEIQLLVLDDRILISANEHSAVTPLVNQAVDGVIDGPTGGLEDWAKARQLDIRQLRSVLKGGRNESAEDLLVRMAASSNIYPEQAPALNTLLRALKTDQFFVYAGDDAASYVTGDEGKNKVILVGSGNCCHAEQNVLIAFAEGGYGGGSATVVGGKRPCAACHVAILLVQKYSFPGLRYVDRHGGAWYNSVKGSLTKLAKALGISVDLIKEEAKLVMPDFQYATAISEEAPEREEITDLRAKVLKKEVATDRLPRERPPSPGLVDDYKAWTPDPLDSEMADREEQEYTGITPSLDLPDSQQDPNLKIPPDDYQG